MELETVKARVVCPVLPSTAPIDVTVALLTVEELSSGWVQDAIRRAAETTIALNNREYLLIYCFLKSYKSDDFCPFPLARSKPVIEKVNVHASILILLSSKSTGLTAFLTWINACIVCWYKIRQKPRINKSVFVE
jgi:hypothetical protein